MESGQQTRSHFWQSRRYWQSWRCLPVSFPLIARPRLIPWWRCVTSEENVNGLLQDIRFALRQLRTKPGFAVTSVLTLGLGIAANVTIFSAVNGLILRPLPVDHPEQIVVLAWQQPGAPIGVYFLSYPELVDLRQQANTFSDIFASQVTLGGMNADNKADHFVGSYVSGNYFSGLRVRPALGRLFLPGEGEHAGSEAQIVLGYSYWQKRFASSPGVIGKR